MTTRQRLVLWATIPGAFMLALMLTNDHVTDVYHLQRVQPFALMSLAKVLLIVVLVMQHPGPPRGVPRWQVWRWSDPLTVCLIGMLAASTLYFVMLWGGNSDQFRAPEWGYTLARQLMWADGYVLIIVGLEMVYRAVVARRDRRLRRTRRNDLPPNTQKGGPP